MNRRLPRIVYIALAELLVTRWFTAFHRRLLRSSGGRIGGGARGVAVILVTTRGRRSGTLRTVPLGAIRDEDAWIVIASNAGHDPMPAWALNMRADPAVTVEWHGAGSPFHAHEAGADEAAKLWPKVLDAYPGYADYQTRTERAIPLFVLQPA
jgi:deazaflavin-dependent oxidoreductase (nitroreductase family)